MKTTFTFEVLAFAGLVAGLAVTTGCRTTYSANNADLSLTPMPESLNPEPVGDVKYPTAESAKPLPYWKANPEAVSALDKVSSTARLPGNASFSSYTVKRGDSLGKIAQAHGIRLADLKAANPGFDPNKIKVGQIIVIPSGAAVKPVTQKVAASTVKSTGTKASGGTYVVKQGDILGRIANAHGVKLSALKAANPGINPDKLKVGQKLVIPGKSVKPAPVSVKPVTIKDKPSELKANPSLVAPVPPKTSDKGDVTIVPPTPPAPQPVTVTPPTVDVTPPVVPVAPAPVVEPVQPVEIPVVAPPAAPAPKGIPYTVTEGQDLFDVSVKWSISADEIKRANNLTSDEIHPGQTLILPTQQAQ